MPPKKRTIKTDDYQGEDRRMKCPDCKSGKWDVYGALSWVIILAMITGGGWGVVKANEDAKQSIQIGTLEESLKEQKAVNMAILKKLDQIQEAQVENKILIKTHMAGSK